MTEIRGPLHRPITVPVSIRRIAVRMEDEAHVIDQL